PASGSARDLHSFPTRRSSDLGRAREGQAAEGVPGAVPGAQGADGGVAGAHDRVPPTMISSTSSDGWPTPTGTLWPFLPHTPTPSSSARSWPTILTRCMVSGPLPIRVAPLTGAVTLPSSIR